MTIGVFDSGLGGELVADRLGVLLPEHEYIVVNDEANVPYGNRSHDDIVALTNRAVQPLIGNCELIVLACNTATAHAIEWLRGRYPDILFVGYEPMLKPASESSQARHVTMCATIATITSNRYQRLVRQFASDIIIDTPSTTDWATRIQAGKTEGIDLSELRVSIASGSDTVVLACTHYLTLETTIRSLFPDVTVIEPTPAVARRITQLVGSLPQ